MNTAKSRALLEDFFADGEEIVFKRRQIIVEPNQPSTSVYWIVSGAVNVFSKGTSGIVSAHYLYKPKELFPVRLFSHISQPTIGFSAYSDVVLRSKPFKAVEKFVEKHPAALIAITVQQNAAYDRILNLNTTAADLRVARTLRVLASRFGLQEENYIRLQLPFTVQEFACYVRLTRESTGKILKNLQDQGAIHINRHKVTIFPDILHKICNAGQDGIS